VEAASLGGLIWDRTFALQDHRVGGSGAGSGPARRRAAPWVGMLRRGEILLPRASRLSCRDTSRDTVRHVLDDRHIGADEEQREAESACRSCKADDDLRLDRDVESRDRSERRSVRLPPRCAGTMRWRWRMTAREFVRAGGSARSRGSARLSIHERHPPALEFGGRLARPKM